MASESEKFRQGQKKVEFNLQSVKGSFAIGSGGKAAAYNEIVHFTNRYVQLHHLKPNTEKKGRWAHWACRPNRTTVNFVTSMKNIDIILNIQEVRGYAL